MVELIVLVVLGVVAWFWYVDRRNTQTAMKTSLGVTVKSVVGAAKAIKAEADIVKIDNDIANIETDRLNKFADRNAERIVTEFMEDIGLGKEFKASQATRLKASQARFEEAKAKAARK